MTENRTQDRNGKLGEYLEHLQAMAQELERSMQAIGQNSLAPLEESIANQQALAVRLRELASELSKTSKTGKTNQDGPTWPTADDEALMSQVRSAAERLRKLNQTYSALLKLSTNSVGMMISLYRSFNGQIRESAGPKFKHATWSCEA
jgi:hypothetical protein